MRSPITAVVLVACAFVCDSAIAAESRCADRFRAAPAVPAPVRVFSSATAVGDFNGDRRADLVLGSAEHGNIGVFLSTGNGRFTEAPGSPPEWAASLVVADLTGDGVLDLAASRSPEVSVLAGDGHGGFTTVWTEARPGRDPTVLAAADVNRDGHVDILVSDNFNVPPAEWTAELRVLIGNGSGGFSSTGGTAVPYGLRPGSAVMGDFNGDLHTDVAVANQQPITSDWFQLLVGDGTGDLQRIAGTAGWPSSRGPVTSLATADFDHDDIVDVVVVSRRGVFVGLGERTGRFRMLTVARDDLNVGSASAAATDFDGDGNVDIAVSTRQAYRGSDVVRVFMSDGVGGFWAAPGSPMRAGGWLHVADLSGDGRPDIVVLDGDAIEVSLEVRALLNTGGRSDPEGVLPIDIQARDRGPVPYGSAAELYGRLKCEPDLLAGRGLILERQLRRAGPWRSVARVTGSQNGLVRWTGRPRASAWYRWRQRDARGPQLSAGQAIRVAVARRVVLLTLNRRRVEGRVVPPRAGVVARLERRTPVGWSVIAQKRLAGAGTFRFSLTGRVPGRYRVAIAGDAEYATGASRLFGVPVP